MLRQRIAGHLFDLYVGKPKPEGVQMSQQTAQPQQTNGAARQDDIQKLNELIHKIDFTMLTTIDTDGTLRSRPMSTQKTPFDGTLWFFTGASSEKVFETRHHNQVNLSYADPKNQRYVSVSGVAELSRDQAKMKELWNPAYKAWFPDGLDDPDLALLKVHVEKAEYWDSPNGTVVTLIGFAKALLTGQRYEGSENEKLDLRTVGEGR
jgi:general stress protein 26